jgi:N-methylhydantoinase A
MGSSGGSLTLERAFNEPVHTVLSGPAGGVVGALEWGRRAGIDRLLSFDMGGTSTDVSLLPGKILHTSEGKIGDLPIAIPLLDIHTVGAGGGSIARIDIGGALRVGPESAGAVPGPISYGKGGREVTVTDANLWLGRLPLAGLLGGLAGLDRGAVEAPIEALANEAGILPDDVAEGILEIVNTAMEGALRVISIERGIDPADFHILSFGGAGGLHAVELASRLGAKGVIIPPDPGLLSAFGMLVAPLMRERARTVFLAMVDGSGAAAIAEIFDELEAGVREEMEEDGVPSMEIGINRSIDARYADQSFELRISADGLADRLADGRIEGAEERWMAEWADRFHRVHEDRFGYRREGVPVVAVTLRVRAEASGTGFASRPAQVGDVGLTSASVGDERRSPVRWKGEWIEALVSRRADLRPGDEVEGPAILTEYSSTTWCPPGWRIKEREGGVLVMERG